jgi:hypothetical protein
MRFWLALLAVALLALPAPASADVIVLDFEGVGDNNPVGQFYNGFGGPNYGVEFSPAALGLVDLEAGGSGDFANEPSPDTILYLMEPGAILNLSSGFDTGFSLFYSSAIDAIINIYDGIEGEGTLLASLMISAQSGDNCVGDPEGSFCNWTGAGVTFLGTARSIDFGDTALQAAFDNVTLGSAIPGGEPTPVPEPATLLTLGAGIAELVRRRRATRI